VPLAPPQSYGVPFGVPGYANAGKPVGDPYLDNPVTPLLSENYNPYFQAAATAATSQTLYCVAIPVVAGVTYTGMYLWVQQAGTSTAPTGFYVGLASYAAIGAAGTMLAQSGNLNASPSLTGGGPKQFAFSAPYVETSSTIRVALILQNGAFAGTAVNFIRSAALGAFGAAASPWVTGVAGTAVAAPNANGQAITANYSATGGLGFWVGLY
jgi:hypothetical protein